MSSACGISPEKIGQIAVNNLVMPSVQKAMNTINRVQGTASRPVGVLFRLQVSVKNRRQHKHGRRLRHPVPDARYPQRSERPGLFLRDQYLTHRLRLVSPVPQIPRQFPKPALYAMQFDRRKTLAIDPRRPAVMANLPPGFGKKILAPNLVAQRMKAPPGFFLRSNM